MSDPNNPWHKQVDYPKIEICNFPKNSREIKQRHKANEKLRNTFAWLSDAFLATPRLVLGYEVSEAYLSMVQNHNVKPKYQQYWRRIAQQHSGMMCGHTYMLARLLTPTDAFEDFMYKVIGKHNFNSGLKSVVEYSNTLKSFKGAELSCETTYSKFDEAIYPIDFYESLLPLICKDKLRPSLKKWEDQFVVEGRAGGLMSIFNGAHHMRLFIFSQNSD